MNIKLENDPVGSVIAFIAGGVTKEPSNATFKLELAAKPCPVIVTDVPVMPLVGVIELMSGVTVKVSIATL